MNPGAVRAICFDLDNTLWEIEPVLARAERILADWLAHRYPEIPAVFSPADVQRVREALANERPDQAHDFTFLRRETLKRVAVQAGFGSPGHTVVLQDHDPRHPGTNPFRDATSVERALREHGAALALVSNAHASLLKPRCAELWQNTAFVLLRCPL